MAKKESKKTKQVGPVTKITRPDKRLFSRIKSEVKGCEKEVLILRIMLILANNSKNPDHWFSLGLLLSDVKKYDSSNEVFNRVVTLNPNHSKVWIAKALALNRLKRVDEAAECYKRALRVIEGKTEEGKEIKDLAGYIDELVTEIERRKGKLDIGNLNNEEIKIITPDIENIEGFIADLLNYIARDENEAKHLLSQLNIPEDSNQDNGE